jgi:hypothetical protein
VLDPGGAVSIELDHGHVPDELAPRRRGQQLRHALEEYVVPKALYSASG